MNLNNIKITPLIDTLRLEKISDEVYFSNEYSNYISNSRLGLINPDQDGTPDKFFEGFKPTYSAAFDLGTGVHCMTLQGDLFTICETVNKPTSKLGALADRLYSICKGTIPSKKCIIEQARVIDYYGGNLSDSRVEDVITKCTDYWYSRRDFEASYTGDREILYFDPKSREIVKKCVSALNNNKKVQKILHPKGVIESPISEMEQAILLDVLVEIPELDCKFTLKLKSKLDNYTIDKESGVISVNDVKTIGKIVSEMNTNIQKFHYNRELAMYSWLLSLCAKKFYNIEKPIIKGNYLVVSTIPGHYTKVIPMTKQMYMEGWNEFRKLLRMVAVQVATNYKNFGEWNIPN